MFTELGGITEETGLGFDEDRAALYGSMKGFGVTVTDTGSRYEVKIFCERPHEREREISETVSALGEGLPKNTVYRLSCEVSFVCAELDKYSLLQEKIVFLTEFLDKLTDAFAALGLVGRDYSFPRVKKQADEKLPEGTVKIKLGFDLRSVLGLIGAAAGALAMTVIAILTVNADVEINTFGLRFEISTYILSGITAAVTFADYRFIARKLDACGVIACPLFTLAAVILSGLGAGVKACAGFAGVSFMQSLREFPSLLERFPDAGSFMFGYITRGIVLAVVACILIYVFYFSRHPDETIRSEKVIDKRGRPGK